MGEGQGDRGRGLCPGACGYLPDHPFQVSSPGGQVGDGAGTGLPPMQGAAVACAGFQGGGG